MTSTSVDGYAAPRSVDEAVALLAKNPSARVLAGGHSLLVEPARLGLGGLLLVDLGRIQGLAGIERHKDGSLKIGAMVTLSDLASSAAVRSAYPALAEAAQSIGDAQLRNRATVGGSLATADPEAPLPALAMVLDATLQVTGPGGARTLAAQSGPLATSLGKGEVLTAMTIPAPAPKSGVGYQVFENPATLHAICGVAASVALAGDGTIAACRVAVAGAAERPARLTSVEQALAGKKPDGEALASASASAGSGLTFRGTVLASAEYRAHLTRVLTRRALAQAAGRAR